MIRKERKQKMKKRIQDNYDYLQADFDLLLSNFKSTGELIGSEKRNVIKIFELENLKINIKSFKKPNLLNSFIYKYVRKSKAQRSFEYANILKSKDIGTPQPFAFYEKTSLFGLQESYYISEQQDVDGMFRDLVFDNNYPNREEIISQTAAFFFKIHELGIEFIDNTAGNTLFKSTEIKNYNFYLVDLNRMRFHKQLSLDQRINNLAKLTTDKYIIKIFSETYAKLYKVSETIFYEKLIKQAEFFLFKFNRRKKLKKQLKFWKK